MALDKGLYVTNSNVTDVSITSGSGLGTISGGVYTAGARAAWSGSSSPRPAWA